MLPLVAAFGHRTNDVIFVVLLAGLIPALAFLVLRRLPRLLYPPGEAENAARPARPQTPELWLVLLLGLGSVLYFSSVIGQVWFTAHVVSLVLLGLYLLCVLPLRYPPLAGLLLGLIYLTRPTMLPFGLLFVLELLRKHSPDFSYPVWPLRRLRAVPLRRLVGPLLAFALPLVVLAIASAVHNYARFARPFEFGHTYLTTVQADNIQRFGLVNYQYLSRNLAAAFTLLPKLLPSPPYIQVSYHGLSLLVTTPALLYLLVAKAGGGRVRARRRPSPRAVAGAVGGGDADRAGELPVSKRRLRAVRVPLQPRLHGGAGDAAVARQPGGARHAAVPRAGAGGRRGKHVWRRHVRSDVAVLL